MLDKNWKKYLSDIFHYIWVWFIWWSISHWFFSWERSIVMAIIWFIMFIIWELLQKQNFKDINYLKILFVWVFYSLSIWMINWWLQHFLDSPERSLWIIPFWFIISLMIFPLKESLSYKEVKKNYIFLWFFSLLISGSIILAYILIPKEFYLSDEHHNEEIKKIIVKDVNIQQIDTKVIKNNLENNDEKKIDKDSHLLDDGHHD